MILEDGVHLLDISGRTLDYNGRPVSVNVYAIISPEGAVLVDSGFPQYARDILSELQDLGGTLRAICLTHSDLDHMGGAAQLQRETGCAVYLPRGEAGYLDGTYLRPENKAAMWARWGRGLPQVSPYPDEEPPGITPLSTPGHTLGHCCLQYRQFLFTGDLCSYREGRFSGPDPQWTPDMNTAAASLNCIRQLPFIWLCPGHGQPVRREEIIDWEEMR